MTTPVRYDEGTPTWPADDVLPLCRGAQAFACGEPVIELIYWHDAEGKTHAVVNPHSTKGKAPVDAPATARRVAFGVSFVLQMLVDRAQGAK